MLELSIVIPVYNSQKYLKECVDSIISEDMNNYEIILINDGSVDNSPEICDCYAEKYKNIKVIHLKNQGVSNARNVGIQNAQGKWIMFVDSDDKLMCSISDLIRFLNCDFDGVYFNYSKSENKISNMNLSKSYVKSRDLLLATFDRMEYFSLIKNVLTLKPAVLDSCWAKLYKTDIIKGNNILFDTELKLSEDTLFNIYYLMCADKIFCADYDIYFYRDNEESVCNNFKRENIKNRQLLLEKVNTIDMDEECVQARNIYCICMLLQLQQQLERFGNKEYVKEFFKLLKKEDIQNLIKSSRRYNTSVGKFRNIRNIIILNLWKLKLYKLSYFIDKCIEKIRS